MHFTNIHYMYDTLCIRILLCIV
eukprot:COSAG02_NODE_57319_length_281_cov_0.571429_1_plen_22_part_10